MSKYEMKGISFDNSFKEKEKQPDFQGKCTIAGVDYKMAGWKRTGNNGDFISWAFSPHSEEKQQPKQIPNEPVQSFGDVQDDLPF